MSERKLAPGQITDWALLRPRNSIDDRIAAFAMGLFALFLIVSGLVLIFTLSSFARVAVSMLCILLATLLVGIGARKLLSAQFPLGRWFYIIVMSIGVILGYAFFYGAVAPIGFVESLYLSSFTFANVGQKTVFVVEGWGRWLTILEGLTGYSILGLVVSQLLRSTGDRPSAELPDGSRDLQSTT